MKGQNLNVRSRRRCSSQQPVYIWDQDISRESVPLLLPRAPGSVHSTAVSGFLGNNLIGVHPDRLYSGVIIAHFQFKKNAVLYFHFGIMEVSPYYKRDCMNQCIIQKH